MLYFIVPLQSREASKDWPLVSRLARRTLLSILAQKHPDFRVLLVCNEPPIDCPSHPQLEIVQRDIPIPDLSVRQNRMEDKWVRVRIGLVQVRPHAPAHIMVVDADDCVSNRLAGFVAAHPQAPGWIFENGWFHDEGSRLIYKRRSAFHEICGTSNILKVTPEDLPSEEEGGRGNHFILVSGHTKIRACMEQRGTPLLPLPFYGAVYVLGTGENHTAFSLRDWRSRKIFIQKLLSYRPLTRAVREEFGLYDLAEAR